MKYNSTFKNIIIVNLFYYLSNNSGQYNSHIRQMIQYISSHCYGKWEDVDLLNGIQKDPNPGIVKGIVNDSDVRCLVIQMYKSRNDERCTIKPHICTSNFCNDIIQKHQFKITKCGMSTPNIHHFRLIHKLSSWNHRELISLYIKVLYNHMKDEYMRKKHIIDNNVPLPSLLIKGELIL